MRRSISVVAVLGLLTSGATKSARCWIIPLATLCVVFLAGCGSSGFSSSTSSFTTPPVSVGTPTQPDPTTSPTTSSTTANAPAGAPSFVVQGTTQDGDKVKVEGRFGSPLRPSESDVDQTALSSCPPPANDGRAMVVRLDLTATLESSLSGKVDVFPVTLHETTGGINRSTS